MPEPHTRVEAFEASSAHAKWSADDVAVWVEPIRSGARWVTGWRVMVQEGYAGKGGGRVNYWPYFTKRAALRYARRFVDEMLGRGRTYV